MKKLPSIAAFLALLTFAGQASANDGKVELSGQFGITTDDSPEVISPRLSAFIPLGSSIAISADFGFGVVTGGGESDTSVLNTFVAGHYMGGGGPLSYRVGFGVGAPTARRDSQGANVAAIASSSPRGLYDLWLYLPETWTTAIPARVAMDLGLVTVAGDGAVVLYIPEEGDADFGFQIAGDALVSLGLLAVGARLQLATVPTADGDLTQLSLNPYLQAQFVAAYARAGLIFNLDEPFGPSFDDGRPFGIDVAVGLTW